MKNYSKIDLYVNRPEGSQMVSPSPTPNLSTPWLIPRPSDVISKSGGCTQAGRSQNVAKQNQDSYIVCPNLLCSLDKKNPQKLHLFGVFDGHGKCGHLISSFMKSKFPKILKKEMAKGGRIEVVLTKWVERVDRELFKAKIESDKSGTTCWVAI